MINKKLVVTGCFALSFVAHAERPVVEHGLIAGASVQVGSYEEDGADSVSPIGGLLSLEKPLTDNFSLRADYAFGLEADSTEVGTPKSMSLWVICSRGLPRFRPVTSLVSGFMACWA